ncbi:conserved membrane hypothetical protein [Hyella patelloides LEGE 07179]|uniref:Glycosyltransferase RgtA/B/C/D-like domain-containing protein n=1 Tax=Hyella patelloides LEGE 07179 TaxID=945734 RepID=A0A563VPQ8_9CYAN|nr:hypothetical protein [Hyella patelloides]VEP13390.1 conserved membrane hypothetical protein [Hyella patelloides LEGE 07179]
MLQVFAFIVITSLFFKAIIDVDLSYDSWWYHLPFAARIWRIVPPELFLGDEKWFVPRFEGFPLLAHFLQGFFWLVSGRIQTANLVSFLSLIIYLFFLKTNFQVPLYLSAIALLAIPLVLTHTTSSLVDLPGSMGFSILLAIAYKLFKQKQLPKKQELLIAVLAAATAANVKTHLQPLVLATVCIVVVRLGWLCFSQTKILGKQLFKFVPIGILAFLLIFATPIKNIILYGNPLYPIKIEVVGIVLNHKLAPEVSERGNRGQKWLRSILEIKSAPWSTEQGSSEPERNRMGGFFGAYVVFNLLLLLGLSIYELLLKDTQLLEARTALVMVVMMSLITAYFPQSHELRYVMFWMILLVSLNLYLISRPIHMTEWLQPKYMGLVYAIFLTFVLSTIHGIYTKPSFQSLEQQILKGVKPELLSQIGAGDRVCLISRHVEFPQQVPMAAMQYVFLYSSYFHPEINYSYSVKAAFNPKSCGERRILPIQER